MSARARLRDLGISIGRFPTGPLNAITDVAGVKVGHVTLIEGEGPLIVGRGPVRTGVTAILPCDGEIFMERLVGGSFVLNGAGELSGLTQVQEWGIIETPILLTNTLAVGEASSGAVRYMVGQHPTIGQEHDVILPLVGECDDSFLNDIAGQHVRAEHARQALALATAGPVAEGAVGGGTGMTCFDLKGGIGTSSRQVFADSEGFILGILVMANFGRLRDLRVDGIPVGEALAPDFAGARVRPSLYGSIIAVLATDAPLSTQQLNRLSKRVALGLGRVGSYAAHGSGEIVLAFSTANRVPRERSARLWSLEMLPDRRIDPLYCAAIECTEEAVLNALCMAETTIGHSGHVSEALPLDRVREIWARHRPVIPASGS